MLLNQTQELQEFREKNHQVEDVLIVKQILLIIAIGNVWRTVWRMCMLISGCKGLRRHVLTKGQVTAVHDYLRWTMGVTESSVTNFVSAMKFSFVPQQIMFVH